MLINLSNHPSANWPQPQLEAAKLYGAIVDLPFPAIDPEAETFDIELLAETYESKAIQLFASEPFGLQAVHIMGELTFCFALVARLQKLGFTCLSSTTSRRTIDHSDGTKTTLFGFVRFREYSQI